MPLRCRRRRQPSPSNSSTSSGLQWLGSLEGGWRCMIMARPGCGHCQQVGGEMVDMRRIAVTGASGSLGGQVVRLLAEQTDGDVVALSRRPTAVPPRVIARIADYADGGELRSGLADVDILVFISSDGEGTRVLAHHLNVVAAARACGVAHIVALSGVDADVESPFCYAVTNGLTEQAIRDSGCGFSIVRASIFAETAASVWVRPVTYRPISAAGYMAQAAA